MTAGVDRTDAASWIEAMFLIVISQAGSTEDWVITTASSIVWLPMAVYGDLVVTAWRQSDRQIL